MRLFSPVTPHHQIVKTKFNALINKGEEEDLCRFNKSTIILHSIGTIALCAIKTFALCVEVKKKKEMLRKMT